MGTDNVSAIGFYRHIKIKICEIYLSPDKIEFALMETPIDKQGKKIACDDPDIKTKQVHNYFDSVEEAKEYQEAHGKKELVFEAITPKKKVESSPTKKVEGSAKK